MGLKRLNPKTLVVLGIALLMAGCDPVVSLHPLFTEKDLVFNEALVGTWVQKHVLGTRDGKEEKVEWKGTLTFQKLGDQAYRVIYHPESEEPAEFKGHVVRLGKFLFLDISPEAANVKNDLYQILLIPAHSFFRLSLDGDMLRLARFDHEELENIIVKKKVKIDYEVLGYNIGRVRGLNETIVLTASTDDLQKLVLEHAEDGKVFHRGDEFRLQK